MTSLNKFKKHQNQEKFIKVLKDVVNTIGSFFGAIFGFLLSYRMIFTIAVITFFTCIAGMIVKDADQVDSVTIIKKTEVQRHNNKRGKYWEYTFLVKYPDSSLHEVDVEKHEYRDTDHKVNKEYYYTHMTTIFKLMIVLSIISFIFGVIILIFYFD